MRRLCTDSSRSYLGRSALHGGVVLMVDNGPWLCRIQNDLALRSFCPISSEQIGRDPSGHAARPAVMHRVRPQKSAEAIVCAGQRVVQEGSSPSGARMRGVISESGGNSSLAEERRKVWRSLNGHEGESRRQPRRTCSHRTRSTSEGRVSTARWDPKGMRRSTGS